MPSISYRRLAAVAMLAGLAACAAQTPGTGGFAPAAPSPRVSALDLGALAPAAIKNAACPGRDIECVTISYGHFATYTFCFIETTSGCATPPLTWTWKFTAKSGHGAQKLGANFKPNPGDPSTDTIWEKVPMPSSNGAVAYQQTIMACNASGCLGPYHIGIITQ